MLQYPVCRPSALQPERTRSCGGTSSTLQPVWEVLWEGYPSVDPYQTCSPSAEPCCVLLFPSAPSVPTQLRLSPGSSTSLVASWAGASGAAWLHLELRNLLTQKVSTTLSARRGLTSYTFQHLQPGTQYWLGLSAMAGSYSVVGPNATAWTCKYELGDPSFLPASGPASESWSPDKALGAQGDFAWTWPKASPGPSSGALL